MLPEMRVSSHVFGRTRAGQQVRRFNINDDSGLSVAVLELGAVLQSVKVADRDGRISEVTLGFDDLASYEVNGPYLGAVIGRFANRIEHGLFELDGREYALEKNEQGKRHIHGGSGGFGKRVWTGEAVAEDEEDDDERDE